MSISNQIPDNIKRASKAIGYAAWLNNADDWAGLSVVLRARLDARQRAALAYAALTSLDDESAYLTASVALFGTLNGEVLGIPLEMKEAA